MDVSPQPEAGAVAAAGSGLSDPRVQAVLARLHREAKCDLFLLARLIPVALLGRLRKVPLTTAAQPIVAKGYFGVFPTVGEAPLPYWRAIDARRVVEFGTSFGISAIYLAAAMRDNDGHFVGSDIDPNKVAGARRHLEEAGLSAFSEVREGDVLETFRDLAAPIDLLLLDGNKDLYLLVLELMKPKLRKGPVVVEDNILHPFVVRKTMARYVASMNDPANGFRSATLPIGAGIEYSVFEG